MMIGLDVIFKNNLDSIWFFLPELNLLVLIILVFLNSIWFKDIKNNSLSLNILHPLSLVFIGGYFIVALVILFVLNDLGFNKEILFNGLFVVSPAILITKIFLLIISSLIIYLSKVYFEYERIYNYEFFTIYTIFLLGAFCFISSNDFLTFYVSLEIQSLALFVLLSSGPKSIITSEATIKYFVLSSLISGFLLFGMSIFYGFTGLTNFVDINRLFRYQILTSNEVLLSSIFFFAIFFIIISILFKLSVAPFHIWTPDVYEGAPTPVTMIMSTIPKLVFIVVLIRISLDFGLFSLNFWNSSWFCSMLYLTALFSLVIGTYGAISQTKIKRLLGYSTILHVGLVVLAFSQGTFSGLQASIFYILVYIINNLGFFSFLIGFRKPNGGEFEYIYELPLLRYLDYRAIFFISLIIFSMAGLPPLLGFWSKFFVLLTLITSASYFTVLFFIVLTVVSTFYYLRIIKILLNDQNFDHLKSYDLLVDKGSRVTLISISVLNVIILFEIGYILDLIADLINLI